MVIFGRLLFLLCLVLQERLEPIVVTISETVSPTSSIGCDKIQRKPVHELSPGLSPMGLIQSRIDPRLGCGSENGIESACRLQY